MHELKLAKVIRSFASRPSATKGGSDCHIGGHCAANVIPSCVKEEESARVSGFAVTTRSDCQRYRERSMSLHILDGEESQVCISVACLTSAIAANNLYQSPRKVVTRSLAGARRDG